jgi:hypothetical protein
MEAHCFCTQGKQHSSVAGIHIPLKQAKGMDIALTKLIVRMMLFLVYFMLRGFGTVDRSWRPTLVHFRLASWLGLPLFNVTPSWQSLGHQGLKYRRQCCIALSCSCLGHPVLQ